MSSTKLQLSPHDLENTPTTIHFLPCKIDFDGPAPVDTYFLVEPLSKREPGSDPELLVANFRGRRLLGRSEKIPSESLGLIVSAEYEYDDDVMSNKDSDDENGYSEHFGDGCTKATRVLRVEGTFKEITHWEHDQAPNSENHVPKWLEFIKLSRVMHSIE